MDNGSWGGVVTGVAGAQRLGIEHLGESFVGLGLYEGLLVAPPLSITGDCGSPLNPIALK